MARWGIIIGLLIVIGALSLISSGVLHLAGDSYFNINQAGFFTGLVHGILAPITLILGLFMKVQMYELNNNGWWYNCGFLLGILIVWGAGSTHNNITKNYYYGDKGRRLSDDDKKDIESLIDKKIDGRLRNKKDKSKDKGKDNKNSNWKFWED